MISSPQTIGLCGLGQMGIPLGLTCWRSGFRVLLFDQDSKKLAGVREQLQAMDAWLKAAFPEERPDYGEILPSADLAMLDQQSDFIFECIREDLKAKVSLFQALPRAAARGVALASCTSGLSVTEMGKSAGCGRQLVGTHFWNPPHLMPLVEVVKGEETSEEAIEIALALCARLGKRPVRVNVDAPGFIGNRMLHAMWREAIHIVEQGIASPEDVDTVAKLAFGFRQIALGPLEHMDLAGLDLVKSIEEYLLADLAANRGPGNLIEEMVKKGRLGMKSGQGFYDWTRRDPKVLIEERDRQIVRELKRMKAGAAKDEEAKAIE
jgi:3-hydroxybutyryl-CoA dehydrogenase